MNGPSDTEERRLGVCEGVNPDRGVLIHVRRQTETNLPVPIFVEADTDPRPTKDMTGKIH